MIWFVLLLLTVSSSIAVGYAAVAFETLAEKIEEHSLIHRIISVIFLFSAVESYVKFADSIASIPDWLKMFLNSVKIGIYIILCVSSLALAILAPPYVIAVISLCALLFLILRLM